MRVTTNTPGRDIVLTLESQFVFTETVKCGLETSWIFDNHAKTVYLNVHLVRSSFDGKKVQFAHAFSTYSYGGHSSQGCAYRLCSSNDLLASRTCLPSLSNSLSIPKIHAPHHATQV